MPNTFIDNRDAWIRMSDVDYVGQFVKAWLAFNAWYRSAYSETQDRKIINEFKWQTNPVLNGLRPKLESLGDDAVQFRAEIGLLHQRLDSYEIWAGKGGNKTRISLRKVFLKENAPCVTQENRYSILFEAELLAGRQVRAEVKNARDGNSLLVVPPGNYDVEALKAMSGFVSLSAPQQAVLLRVYSGVAPDFYCDLTAYEDTDGAEIQCGAYTFKCGRDNLFAGCVEALYQMRCTLFHGELAPTKEAILCYEPAFRLVRRFLDSMV